MLVVLGHQQPPRRDVLKNQFNLIPKPHPPFMSLFIHCVTLAEILSFAPAAPLSTPRTPHSSRYLLSNSRPVTCEMKQPCEDGNGILRLDLAHSREYFARSQPGVFDGSITDRRSNVGCLFFAY